MRAKRAKLLKKYADHLPQERMETIDAYKRRRQALYKELKAAWGQRHGQSETA